MNIRVSDTASAASDPSDIQFSSADLGEVRDIIGRTYCPHALKLADPARPIKATLRNRTLSKIEIGFMRYGTGVHISEVGERDVLLLMLPLSGHAEISTTRDTIFTGAACASVTTPREMTRMHWSEDCVQHVIQISGEVIREHATLLMGRPFTANIAFSAMMPFRQNTASCWQYADLIGAEAGGAAEAEGSSFQEELQSLFLTKLLETHPSDYRDQMGPQPCKIAPRHVRRVEEYIVAHARTAVTLDRLVEVSGVSARALFDGFRRFRGTSPIAFAKAIRLQHAHADLLQAGPGDTVTSIAAKWGFFQFGRFSGQYKKMFGQLPSETLRGMR